MKFTVLITGITLLLPPTFALARTIEMPTNFQVEAIYRNLAGQPPDLESAARESEEYRAASEFDRATVLERQMEAKKAEFDNLKDVEAITLRARTSISEYDSAKGAYYIDAFQPGTYYPFGNYDVLMENGEQFRAWELPVEEARAVRDRVGDYASLTAEITIRTFGAAPGGERQIRGQITDVKLFHDDALLYEQTLDTAEYRQIVVAGETSVEEKPVAAENLTVAGIPLSMYLEETLAVLHQEGYAHVEGMERGEPHNHRPVGFSTDEATLQSFKSSSDDRTAQMVSDIMGRRSGRHYLTDVFGPDLDCRGETDALEKCGYFFARSDGHVHSIVQMQQAMGVSEDTITEALVEKYGQPSDSMPATVMNSYRGQMLVWGRSSRDLGETVPAVAKETENQHWQIEAFIVEPEEGRRVVIVQLNEVSANAGASSEADGGGIEF